MTSLSGSLWNYLGFKEGNIRGAASSHENLAHPRNQWYVGKRIRSRACFHAVLGLWMRLNGGRISMDIHLCGQSSYYLRKAPISYCGRTAQLLSKEHPATFTIHNYGAACVLEIGNCVCGWWYERNCNCDHLVFEFRHHTTNTQ